MNDRRIDQLVSRAVDGDATAQEWIELSGLAEGAPGLWRHVAMTLRDRGGFGRAMAAALAVADGVDLPAAAAAAAPRRRLPWMRLVSAGGGWAVAALVGLAWGLTILSARLSPVDAMRQPVAAAPVGEMLDRPPRKEDLAQFPAEDLLAAYFTSGKRENLVVGELPEKVLLDSRSAPSGHGYEILYVRPIVERTFVPDLYEFGARDETGRPTAVPVRYDGAGPPR